MQTVALPFSRGALAWVAAAVIACGGAIEVQPGTGGMSAGSGAASTGSTGATSVVSSTTTTTTTTTSASSGSTGSGTGGAMASAGSVRFANLDTAMDPFDVCASADGAPLLAPFGLTDGLHYPSVSRYLAAGPNTIWTMVPPGAPCSAASAVPLAIVWPKGSEVPGTRVTVVPYSDTPALTAYAYLDEPVNNQYGINVRVLNFLSLLVPGSGTYASVQQQSPGESVPSILFPKVWFAQVPAESPVGAVSSAGFLHTPYTGVGELTVQPDLYVPMYATRTMVPIPGGEGNAYGVASVFLAGAWGTAVDPPASLDAVVCDDNAPPQGALSSCSVLTMSAL
jgi:hypothetical protein